jgi:hypothetical protein
LIRMHLLANSRACSSDSRFNTINGRDVSQSAGTVIVKPWRAATDASSGNRNSE